MLGTVIVIRIIQDEGRLPGCSCWLLLVEGKVFPVACDVCMLAVGEGRGQDRAERGLQTCRHTGSMQF